MIHIVIYYVDFYTSENIDQSLIQPKPITVKYTTVLVS